MFYEVTNSFIFILEGPYFVSSSGQLIFCVPQEGSNFFLIPRVRLFFFVWVEARIFFLTNIRARIFFSKKTHPPPLEVKWSLLCGSRFPDVLYPLQRKTKPCFLIWDGSRYFVIYLSPGKCSKDAILGYEEISYYINFMIKFNLVIDAIIRHIHSYFYVYLMRAYTFILIYHALKLCADKIIKQLVDYLSVCNYCGIDYPDITGISRSIICTYS